MAAGMNLTWSDIRFECAGTHFVIEWGKPRPQEFWIAKHRWMIERYQELLDLVQPQRILELGVYSGGSTALLALLARPEKLVGIDIEDRTPKHFQSWLVEQNLEEVVRMHMGIDQSDVDALHAIVDGEFGSELLDLIIDDASHRLEPTVASFNALFPRLRPGGVYVIEDWSWQLAFAGAIEGQPGNEEDMAKLTAETPLGRLVLELALAAAYGNAVDDLSLRGEWLAVRRGPAAIDEPDAFKLSDCYGELGRSLLSS